MNVVTLVAIVVSTLTAAGLLGGGVRWLYHGAIRFHELTAAIARVESSTQQLDRNNGKSIADAVHRIERRLDALEKPVRK